MKWVGISLVVVIVLYLGIQAILCSVAVRNASIRLESYQAKTIRLGNGDMTYVDTSKSNQGQKGSDTPVLAIHGICGGYDQAISTANGCFNGQRIIAPSRFGYPGSDVPAEPTPKEQAKAYAELLDALGIKQAYVLAASAGGTSAIRFALDYPDRVKGLILLSSVPPLAEKSQQYLEYQGPPAALNNNYAMWLCSPLFGLTMGFEPSTIHEILPMDDRKAGIQLDAAVSNPDMARNFDQYPIEQLKVRTIVLHAKDDKMASYADMAKATTRFPNCTFVSFEDGGHKIKGHVEEIANVLTKFINA